jgi:hypothetical protein
VRASLNETGNELSCPTRLQEASNSEAVMDVQQLHQQFGGELSTALDSCPSVFIDDTILNYIYSFLED